MSSHKEILALEDKRYAAMYDGEFAALETMLHDELLYTHSSGLTDTKASWLESMTRGEWDGASGSGGALGGSVGGFPVMRRPA